jgi:hypothetical protein
MLDCKLRYKYTARSSLSAEVTRCTDPILSSMKLFTILDVIFIVLLRTGTTTPFRLPAMMKSSIPSAKVDADDADPKVRLP